jgi:NitT/TauT family transport system substrate-binding protein
MLSIAGESTMKGERMKRRFWIAGAAVLALVAAIAAATATAAGSKHHAQKLTKVTLQLKWVTQAQFAGYYAAKAKGYYKQQGLDVSIKVGGPDIIPEQVVAGGQAEFGIDWLPNLLSTRDQGTNLVNIAQVFPRSGMTQLTWKDTGINSIAKMKGKKVANWLGGNEWEIFAALVKNGMDPLHNKGVTIVKQPFDMNLFMKRQVDSASAMTYNELAQVLETKNPKTGKLTKMSDLNVIKMQDVGTGMLEDGVFVRGDWLNKSGSRDTATKFLTASFKGWIYCRDHVKECTNIVLAQGPTLLRMHQTWQMNEVNKLIWPNKLGIGVMDPAAFSRTASIAKQFGVIKKAPSAQTWTATLAKAADQRLRNQHLDVNGKKFKPITVKVTANGK